MSLAARKALTRYINCIHSQNVRGVFFIKSKSMGVLLSTDGAKKAKRLTKILIKDLQQSVC